VKKAISCILSTYLGWDGRGFSPYNTHLYPLLCFKTIDVDSEKALEGLIPNTLSKVKLFLAKISLFNCLINLTIGFMFYSILLILIYTKIRLRLPAVCPSGPCII